MIRSLRRIEAEIAWFASDKLRSPLLVRWELESSYSDPKIKILCKDKYSTIQRMTFLADVAFLFIVSHNILNFSPYF